MDGQDKIWDDVLGFLAWKFEPTQSGDMLIDSDEVIPELKKKYTIETFESFVQEGIGAISMSTQTSQYNPIVPPDVRMPMQLPINYTGGSRVPMHWNNSPFLSGSIYGVDGGGGWSSFGANPDEDEFDQWIEPDFVKAILDKEYKSKDEVWDMFKRVQGAIEQRRQLRKAIEHGRRQVIARNEPIDKFETVYLAAISQLGLKEEDILGDEFDLSLGIEMLNPPTPDQPDGWDHPGHPGDSGEYSIWIDDNESNRKVLRGLGLTPSQVDSMIELDIFDIFNQFSTRLENNPVADLALKMYRKWEEMVSELDYEYAQNDITKSRASIVDDFDIYEDRDKMMFRRMMVVTAKDQAAINRSATDTSRLLGLRKNLERKWKYFKEK